MSQNVKNIVFMLSILSLVLPQRDFDEELEYQNKSIKSLKKEIKSLQDKLKTMSAQEESSSNKIVSLEKEIYLTERLISELANEEKNTRKMITETEKKLTDQDESLLQLRERYKKRVLKAHIDGRPSALDKLFSPVAWRQSVYRKEYLKVISAKDDSIRKSIKTLLIEIGQDKLNLEAGLRKNIYLNRERSKQKNELKQKKSSREKQLASLKINKKEMSEYLKEKSKGLKELEEIRVAILEDKARFEREKRIRKQQEALRSKKFTQLKGQLPWPIDGKVVTKFGRQWNPKLKTTTEYPGIDIRGKADMPVQTVLNGIVATVTYLRGYGTTVIIDHGGGFFTVYSQLKTLKIHVNSEVQSGDVIAFLDESSSEHGAVLHFEIWGNGQKLDPEKWLIK